MCELAGCIVSVGFFVSAVLRVSGACGRRAVVPSDCYHQATLYLTTTTSLASGHVRGPEASIDATIRLGPDSGRRALGQVSEAGMVSSTCLWGSSVGFSGALLFFPREADMDCVCASRRSLRKQIINLEGRSWAVRQGHHSQGSGPITSCIGPR